MNNDSHLSESRRGRLINTPLTCPKVQLSYNNIYHSPPRCCFFFSQHEITDTPFPVSHFLMLRLTQPTLPTRDIFFLQNGKKEKQYKGINLFFKKKHSTETLMWTVGWTKGSVGHHIQPSPLRVQPGSVNQITVHPKHRKYKSIRCSPVFPNLACSRCFELQLPSAPVNNIWKPPSWLSLWHNQG